MDDVQLGSLELFNLDCCSYEFRASMFQGNGWKSMKKWQKPNILTLLKEIESLYVRDLLQPKPLKQITEWNQNPAHDFAVIKWITHMSSVDKKEIEKICY